MNAQLILSGLSLVQEMIPAQLGPFPEKPFAGGASLCFEQTGVDVQFPEAVALMGISLVEMQFSPTQIRRRRLIL